MQKSKLQSWCEGVIEAGWLAALIVAPLFFNVYSSRVFEPDKISLIRTISLIMLLAYLIKLADGGRAWLPGQRSENVEPAADPGGDDRPWYRRMLQIPFLLPVLLLILAYLVSTLFSVAPAVSWWGSYQRLQGTYSFLSYIIIALLTVAHLRQPEQLRRLQHAIIITSLPIAIYGVIQHIGIDPLPWGGDVQTRVSGNAGNPIFLSAYLIMAFFLTLERIYSSFAYLLTVDNDADEGTEKTGPDHDVAGALIGGSYLFILIIQILAIVWTQSRGPQLGLLAGFYIFILLLLSGLRPRNYRFWTASWVGLGVVGALFLVLINTTPVGASLSQIPYLERMTTILETDGGTGRVRVLIWGGVAEMIAPHDPLIFPDGQPDRINPIRPLVGYGPETMWVAYNSFYPPDLAQLEARNASPDRAHNETWDSLAITGIFGFVAYVLLFMAIFYWSLRWLGLIASRRDLLLFLGFWLGGGVLLSVVFYFYDQSWDFFGVALPTGFILGLIAYVTVAVFLHPEARIEREDRRRQLLIVAILATITAHYIEIHFGIAIAATRTYFWILTAVLLAVGMRWLEPEPFAVGSQSPAPASSGKTSTRKGRTRRQSDGEGGTTFLPGTVMPDLMVMLSLAFLYTTNFQGLTSTFGILGRSLSTRMSDGMAVSSPGILFLLIFTWLMAATVGISSAALRRSTPTHGQWWLRSYLKYSGILWGGWLLYGLIQAGRLVPGAAGGDLAAQLNHIAGHFTLYTWVVITWALGAGVVFAWPYLNERRAGLGRALVSLTGGTILAVIIFAIVSSVNVALVRADIFYKQGQQFDSSGDWISSAELYRRALAVRPTEDHYMLFLGRALLEQAKRAPEEDRLVVPQTMDVTNVLSLSPQEISQMGSHDLLRAAEAILQAAQEVNPLNTDHTANLARLYRSWADLESDPVMQMARPEQSLEYYEVATMLSPNAAHLWNEKGGALVILGRTDEAERVYQHSLSIDSRFEITYMLLAGLYEQEGRSEDLIALLEQGLEVRPTSSQIRNYLGIVQARAGQVEEALATNLASIERDPNDPTALRNIAILYRDLTQYEESIRWAQQGLAVAQQQNWSAQLRIDMHRLLAEVYGRQGEGEEVLAQYEAMHRLSPDDASFLTTLATLYIQNDRMADATLALQNLSELQPENYRHPLQLAQIYLQMGQSEAARESAQRALALAPEGERPSIQQFLSGIGG
jgi:tetratricopeptide (TPR) repeat protein/O-antigen ligase